MNYFQALIISFIEGITEFLPISSTAHMKFANPIIGVNEGAFTNLFEVVLDHSLIGSDASVKGLSRSLNIGDNTEIDLS